MVSKLVRGQRGFTLIELLAVMAIMAVLVAVVAPAVTGSKDASVDAQVMQDANQVRSAATSFYKNQNESEVRTPHTILTTAKLPTASTAAVAQGQQMVSSRWPEIFVTLQKEASTDPDPAVAAAPAKVIDIGAKYAQVFPTKPGDNIDEVVLLDKNGITKVTGTTLLADYTAINIKALLDEKLLQKAPAGSELVSNGIPNFLWLFLKTGSAADRPDDSREVAVFKLIKVVKLEGTAATKRLTVTVETDGDHVVASETNTDPKVQLTYQRVF